MYDETIGMTWCEDDGLIIDHTNKYNFVSIMHWLSGSYGKVAACKNVNGTIQDSNMLSILTCPQPV